MTKILELSEDEDCAPQLWPHLETMPREELEQVALTLAQRLDAQKNILIRSLDNTIEILMKAIH
jgi:hypothetical protein